MDAPPEARVSWTLLFRDITGGVARTETSGRAHVGDGPRVVHGGGRRSTRYAWRERRCRLSRRGEGETTAWARGAGDLAPSQVGRPGQAWLQRWRIP